MSEEVTTTEDTIGPMIQDLFYPHFLTSFYEGPVSTSSIQLRVHRNEGVQTLTLNSLFPFSTILDIKIALYIRFGKDDAFAPDFVYLSRPPPVRRPVDFLWDLPSAMGGGYISASPIKLANGTEPLDTRFVDSTGQRKLIGISSLERMTIEDYSVKSKVQTLLFDVYLYSDLVALVPGPRPMSEKEWNGRLYPFFPTLGLGTDAFTPQRRERLRRLVEIYEKRQGFLEILESFLKADMPLIPMTFAGVRLLRLVWDKPKKSYPGIEALFYEASVTKRRPYMRLIPTEASAISKVHMLDKTRPDIPYVKVLETWLRERSPTPERDYAFAKILLRNPVANLPPIYGTLRLFDDGTADCIVEPPKPMKKLDILTDLQDFSTMLREGVQGFPYLKEKPSLGNGTFIFGFKMQKEDAPFTVRSIRARLPIFSGMFQEILPLPGEKPLAVLRYKLVSNFATEDRIFTFMSQVMSRKLLKGEAVLSELAAAVSEEFQIDIGEAQKKVAEKLRNEVKVTTVASETHEYILTNNPGTDIAIYAQHPFYTLNFYRVDSYETLQRSLTALSILFSASQEDLQVSSRVATQLKRVELREAIEGEGAAPGAEEGLADEVFLPGVPSALAGQQQEQQEEQDQQQGQIQSEKNVMNVGDADVLPDYLDSFMMDYEDQGQEQQTIEEEHKAEEIKQIISETIEEKVKRQTQPREELQDIPNLPAASSASSGQGQDKEEPAEPLTIANFFINKLKEADRRLFDYTKNHPSLKKYVSQCQVTHMRQPAVLSEAKYNEMLNEYADDDIVFILYPLEKGEVSVPPAGTEFYTVLRYGSSLQNQNYYLCSKYFCVRDEILIREKDLRGTRLRRPVRRNDGTVLRETKAPMTCPFCEGTIITNRDTPGSNQTVLERTIKPTTKDGRHLYISFLKKTQHPDGFPLPCCFMDEHPIRYTDPLYQKYRESLKESSGAPEKGSVTVPTDTGKAVLEEDEEEEAAAAAAAAASFGPRDEGGLPIYDYTTLLATATKRYIVGAEKFPLEVGIHTRGGYAEQQIGLLPESLDEYFDQDQTKLVSRAFNPQKIKPDGQGFLRVGVENRLRYKNDSILAAVAPFYLKNSAAQMKELLVGTDGGGGVITPRVFLGMNYGNLAIEFYDPTDRPGNPEGETVLKNKVRQWASSNELDTDMTMGNEESLVRAYLSWIRFQGVVSGTSYKKEFRHFALFFAQANFIRGPAKPGITFIVLDILRSGKVQVRCQPYGYTEKAMARNDIGFLLHHWSGIWEPLFYIDNRNAEERRGTDIYSLLFRYSNSTTWPSIVKQRVQEYKTQCVSVGRAIYTSQSRINSRALVSTTIAKSVLSQNTGVRYEGLVRDAYNHIAAMLFSFTDPKKGAGLIPVPVVDDGTLLLNGRLFLDWEDIHPLAPVNYVMEFYTKTMEPIFRIYKGYTNPQLKITKESKKFYVQLENMLVIPADPPLNDAAVQEEIRIADEQEASGESDPKKLIYIDEIEWAINHEIEFQELYAKKEDVSGAELPSIHSTELREIYEHFRLTFSNWLASDGGSLRQTLESVIFDRGLPLFEKRKRLEILLGEKVMRWLTTDLQETPSDTQSSLLRVDCRLRTEDACTGRCSWGVSTKGKADAKKSCLLHVPTGVKEIVNVSASKVLFLRLIDELLLYGEKRRELMEQGVSRMAVFEDAIRIGDQMIYPEKSAAWYEFLRFTWAKKMDEYPLFLEEMSASAEAEEGQGQALANTTNDTALPETLMTLLGPDDPKTGALRLLRIPMRSVLAFLGKTPASIGMDGTAAASELSKEQIKTLVQATNMKIVQINLLDASVIPYRPTRETTKDIAVIVVTDTGPAILVLQPNAPAYLRPEQIPSGLAKLIDNTKSFTAFPKKVRRPAVTEESSGPVEEIQEAPVEVQEAPVEEIQEAPVEENNNGFEEVENTYTKQAE
jgi:hypothetical protein